MKQFIYFAVLATAATALLLASANAADDQATDRANRAKSKQNLQTQMKAMHKYLEEHGRFPPAAVYDREGKPLLSWRVLLLPYLGEEELFKEFKLDESWDSPHNKKLINRIPKAYVPANIPRDESSAIFYKVFVGKGAAFEKGRTQGTSVPDFKDGTVCTILIVEAREAVSWTKPSELEYDPDKTPPQCGGLFSDGFHAAFASGDVYFVKKEVPDMMMHKAITRDGREIFNPETDLPLVQ